MKLSGTLFMLLFVVLIVGTVVMIFQDLETNYPEIEASEELETLTGTYDFNEGIEASMNEIKEKWDDFQNADTAWEKFQGLIGMVPIPFILLFLPGKILIASLDQGITFISQAGSTLKIPGFVIVLATTGLLVGIVLSLINWWHSRERL